MVNDSTKPSEEIAEGAVDALHEGFAREARGAPALFADLAKIECYIAETYRTRAFVELLQNADDAGSSRFSITMRNGCLLAMNDGRPFVTEDVEALCRSGASNKRRGAGTIGYRGIGFKSVAGLASRIDAISGTFCFRFDKTLTMDCVGAVEDVPLIRVPHPRREADEDIRSLRSIMAEGGWTTAFVLHGLNLRLLSEEAKGFEPNTMLFLNAIQEIMVDIPPVKMALHRSRETSPDFGAIERISLNGDDLFRWLVLSTATSPARIALCLSNDNTVIPAPRDQSVIHSFMPTTEFSGAFLKFHGDYSTDPSRKIVDIDTPSAEEFGRCVELLASVLRRASAIGNFRGVFSVLLSSAVIEGRFRKRLLETLVADLEKDGLPLPDQGSVPLSALRLAPDWIDYEDYECLCVGTMPFLPRTCVMMHPDMPAALRLLGAKALSTEEALELTNTGKPSPSGYARLWIRASRQYRFDLDNRKIDWLGALPLVLTVRGAVSARNYNGDSLDKEFLQCLGEGPEGDDIRFIFRKVGLPTDLLGPIERPGAPACMASKIGNQVTGASSLPSPSAFNTRPAIVKWRSAEHNVAAYFSALSNVVGVKDVSQANLGYDLEVILYHGRRLYVEVKSVKYFGEPFRLTNNEHATGFQHGDSYMLAVAVSGDEFEVRVISDPIRSLALEKRCEQWSWYCEDYVQALEDMAGRIGGEKS